MILEKDSKKTLIIIPETRLNLNSLPLSLDSEKGIAACFNLEEGVQRSLKWQKKEYQIEIQTLETEEAVLIIIG